MSALPTRASQPRGFCALSLHPQNFKEHGKNSESLGGCFGDLYGRIRGLVGVRPQNDARVTPVRRVAHSSMLLGSLVDLHSVLPSVLGEDNPALR